MATTILNEMGFTYSFAREGYTTLAPGESAVIVVERMACAVQVAISGTETAEFMLSTTVDSYARIRADGATFVDASATEFSADKVQQYDPGLSAVKVLNAADSTDNIVVSWGY